MDPSPPPAYVTQPYLPPLAELVPYLEEIWKNRCLTNAGPLQNHERNAAYPGDAVEDHLADLVALAEKGRFDRECIQRTVSLNRLHMKQPC